MEQKRIRWLASGGDVGAGLALAAVAIPEQMAIAKLGGFSPETAMFAFVAASFAFAIFGRNPLLSAGADSTITPIFAGALGTIASATADRSAMASILAIWVGVLVGAAGALRLGRIVDILSKPVTTGFLAGIAAHIAISQMPSILGIGAEAGTIWMRVQRLLASLSDAQPAAVGIGVGTLFVIFVSEKLSVRVPGALVAVIGSSWLTMAANLDRRGLQVVGAFHAALPTPRLPAEPFETVQPLIGLSLVLAVIVMVQTGATTRNFNPDDPDVNRDFIGLGAAGICAGLVGAFPVNASPPRTAVAAQAGAQSKWAGVVAALAVSIFLAFGGLWMARTPSAALAGVLLFIALRLVHTSAWGQMLRHAPREFAHAIATALLIVVLPIETGVAIGISISLAFGILTIARAKVVLFEQVPGTTIWWPNPEPDSRRPIVSPPFTDVLVMGFQAPLSFLNAHEFRRGVLDAIAAGEGPIRLFVLEASGVIEVDFTAAEILKELIARLRSQGVEIAVARLEAIHARRDFDRFGVTQALGMHRLFRSVAEALEQFSQAPQTPSGGRGKEAKS